MTTTIVSGYWFCTNKHGNKFMDWFGRTLRINCPYVFFGPAETIVLAKQFRRELPTHYVELDLVEFHTQAYKADFVTHPTHCPSQELNMIWNEKLFLMQRAAALNPFGSEWFAWADAGICTYRDSAPPTQSWPSPKKLLDLPKNKLIFTTSDSPTFYPRNASEYSYYHYISGTSYLIHRSTLDHIVQVFDSYLKRITPKKGTIYTDQVILTLICKDHPELFHRLGDGYGAVVPLLF